MLGGPELRRHDSRTDKSSILLERQRPKNGGYEHIADYFACVYKARGHMF